MHQDLPFTRENRPWLPSECIDAMNAQFASCMSQIPEVQRDALRDWAITKVELGYCHDQPQILEKCRQWGRRQGILVEPV